MYTMHLLIFTGCSTALHLAQMTQGQAKILVVEKDFKYRNNSAMLSAGGIRQHFSTPENIRMSMYGIEFIKNIQSLQVENDGPLDVNFREK